MFCFFTVPSGEQYFFYTRSAKTEKGEEMGKKNLDAQLSANRKASRTDAASFTRRGALSTKAIPDKTKYNRKKMKKASADF